MPWHSSRQTEVVAIHAALLTTSREGDILIFGDWAGIIDHPTPTHCRLYHMASATVESFADRDRPSTNAFCAGQSLLARGALLVAGGQVRGTAEHDHVGHVDAERACWVYLPEKKFWIRVKDLNFQPGGAEIGGGRYYPTLVTLPNGEVFAAGGHPADTDDYAPLTGGLRHNNNTPERYSPSADAWTLIRTDFTAPNDVVTDSYPRFRLLPNGLLFTDTDGLGVGKKRIFDPMAGRWTDPAVDVSALPPTYGRGSRTTSVLLPLLPPNYSPRVLACNSPHLTTFLIDVNGAPKWEAQPPRRGSAAGKGRDHACAVLLPTGQVLLSGGGTGGMPNARNFKPVLEPELYTPDIDWNTGAFTGPGSWETIAEPASVARGYHSVALLLPDGRVWTAGGTEDGFPDKQVEIFSPWYIAATRPRILPLPKPRPKPAKRIVTVGVDYGKTFNLKVSGNIGRVALMRCGSVTHAFDSDQRYVGLAFQQNGDQLQVTAPPHAAIAPPGYYMLWVIDRAGVPCQHAQFVHLPTFRRVPKPPFYRRRPPKHVPPWKKPRPKKPKHPPKKPKHPLKKPKHPPKKPKHPLKKPKRPLKKPKRPLKKPKRPLKKPKRPLR